MITVGMLVIVISSHPVTSYFDYLSLMGKFNALKFGRCINLQSKSPVSPKNIVIRGITIHDQEVNYPLLAYQGENKGHSRFWSRLVIIKSSYLICDIMNELIEEFYVSPTVGEE